MNSIIDAHQHFWDRSIEAFDYAWLDQEATKPIGGSYVPRDLQPLIRAAGVDYTVFVQTQHNVAENRWVLGLADHHPYIAGVVGWVDLASPECEEQLMEFKDHDKFVGIRHITHDEPDDDFIVRPDVMRGLNVLQNHGVPFDLLFFPRHLQHAATLGAALPDLPMVIDHIAKPRIKDAAAGGLTQAVDEWLPAMKAAAACDNIYCKLSGMITEADWRTWKAADLKPFVQHALDLFGPDRCMFGSDWPVCLLAGSYQQVLDALREALGPISENERNAIFGGTAAQFYDLNI